MPLIIICGTPVSGKTTRALELKDYFQEHHQKHVEIVSEDEAIKKLGYDKNSTYLDSQKEKRIRGYLKSEVIKLIGKDNLVILDGSNYIKGYRYELYCASKASKCTQCTLYTIRYHEDAWRDNLRRSKGNTDSTAGKVAVTAESDVVTAESDEVTAKSVAVTDESDAVSSEIETVTAKTESAVKITDEVDNVYSKEVFDALTKLRFEEPNSNNRWDSPLFTVQPSDQLDLQAVYSVLFERKPPPPNMSTQNEPNSNNRWDSPLFTVQPSDQLDLQAVYSVLFERKPPPPNMSTQNPPLSSTNFLYELDRVTQAINKYIIDAKQLSMGGELKFPEYPGCRLDAGITSLMSTNRLVALRRQFLTYAKQNHSSEPAATIGRYYIQYLNKTLTD